MSAPDPASVQESPAPFIVGVGRSGTTLLRLMLDAHPQLAIPPETQFIPELVEAAQTSGATAEVVADVLVSHRRFGDFGISPQEARDAFAALDPFDLTAALRWFYLTYAQRHGKERWGDKSPGYGWMMEPVERALPEAHFIHLIRDGRDVALSKRAKRDDDPSAERLARHWAKRIRWTREQGQVARHYMELRYEDLVAEPGRELRRICEFIELEFDVAILQYHEGASDRLSEIARDLPAGTELDPGRTRDPVAADKRVAIHQLATEPPRADRIAKWRTDMSETERVEFERVAGDVLTELGYETLER